MKLGPLFFALARNCGKYYPFPWFKWQSTMGILRLGKIHPWDNPDNWLKIIQDLDQEEVAINGLKIRGHWKEDPGFLLTRDCEPYICNVAKKIIRNGDVVIDAGANVGITTLSFAVFAGPDGRVYAYEPVKKTLEKLYINLKTNEHVKKAEIVVREKALGNTAKPATIYIPKTRHGKGFDHALSSLIRDFQTGREMVQHSIEMTRLDDENIQGPIAFVKCDVEGAEKLFLEGGRLTLARHKPIIIFEYSPGINTYSAQEFAGIVKSIGDYEFFDIRHFGLSPVRSLEEVSFATNILCAISALHGNRLSRLIR